MTAHKTAHKMARKNSHALVPAARRRRGPGRTVPGASGRRFRPGLVVAPGNPQMEADL